MKKITIEPVRGDPEFAPEAAFQNGKEAMREAVVDKLRDMKGRAMGKDRALLSDLIDMVRKMEVIP